MRVGKRSAGARRRIARALTLLCAGACVGCVSGDDAWTFGLSREIYPALSDSVSRDGGSSHEEYPSGRQGMAEEIGAVFLFIAAIPLIADLVMLPVTAPHDLLWPLLSPDDGERDREPIRPAPPPPRLGSL